ncbi:hypothetical protein PsYK624_145090 [Phanerochaete sordida]|uniref:Uncharacterized protein n=1 Tax=Phanerochaete sordida TaxID=48140 RepID=A0A9P3GM16_9APHY|nr:hypothetical protein PsYK624_145090 [Phanerochaete sordida]
MSSAAWAEYIAALEQATLSAAVNYAMAVLSIYEFFINLDLEVATAWRRKATVSSVLLLSIRWCMLAYGVLTLACMAPAVLAAGLNIAGFAQAALFSALRVHALANGHLVLSAAVFVLNLVPVGTNIFRDLHYVCESSDGIYFLGLTPWAHPIICTFYNADRGWDIINPPPVSFSTRCSLVLADVIVLLVTWAKTFDQWRSSHRLNVHLPVTTCLMRDGTGYFIVLLGMNIIDLTGVVTSIWQIVGLNGIIVYLPPIIISRFLLTLRDCTNDCGVDASLPLSSPSVRFAAQSTSGNIGALLDYTRDVDLGAFAIESEEQNVNENAGEDSRADVQGTIAAGAGLSPV